MPLFDQNAPLRRSLVLAGGGVRLAYHAGVLMALEEAGVTFNHVDGTSGGIFGTAMMASGMTPIDAAERWRKLRLKGFMGLMPSGSGSRSRIGNGADGIRKAIFPALGISAPAINQNTLFDTTFNVCNFSDKSVEAIPGELVTEDHLVAGMSLPMFMPAIRIGEDWYTDAVWIKDANVREAVRRGAQEVWLIWCIGNNRTYYKGYFREYVHMIEISANAGLLWELEELSRQGGQNELPRFFVVKPEFPLPLDPDFFLKKIDADTLISMGYADTRTFLKDARPLDLSNVRTATAMRETIASLHFRQEFRGKADWNGVTQLLSVRLAYFAHITAEGYALQCFATLVSESGTPVCGFDTHLQRSGPGVLLATFKLQVADTIAEFQVTSRYSAATDLLLGLDAQYANLQIKETGGPAEHYTFHQDIRKRLSNALHVSMIGPQKPWARWKLRQQALRWLLAG